MITIILDILLLVLAAIILIDAFTGFKLMKSLFNRVFQAKDNIIEAVRDPVADAHTAIAQITARKETAKSTRKKLLTKINVHAQKIATAKKNVVRFEELAVLAGKAKNAEDVRTALDSKNSAVRRVNELEEQLKAFRTQEDTLEKQIQECESLIERALDRKEILEHELESATFAEEVATVLTDNAGAAQSAVQQLENDVALAKAKAATAQELAGENQSLDDKYRTDPDAVTDSDIAKYLND